MSTAGGFGSFPARWRWLMLVALLATFLGGYLLRGGGSPDAESGHEHLGGTAEEETWTCSMHPQVKQPKPGDCPICGMDLIPLGGGDDLHLAPAELQLSPRAQKLAEVELATVERKHLEYELRLPGSVNVAETALQRITSRVAGRLDRLHVATTGTQVAQGDPLVEIYSGRLIAAQEEFLQAVRSRQGAADPQGATRATQLLQAAREKLILLGLTGDQVREIERSKLVTDQVTIQAPLQGVVLRLEAVEGDYVDVGTPLLTIADLSRVWVMLEAYAEDLPLLTPGQRVELQVPSLPGEVLVGQVDFIDPVLDPRTRTAQVRVEMDNEAGLLKPGIYLHGTVMVGSGAHDDMHFAADPETPLVIPASAPLITGRRAVVYVASVDHPGRYEGREVILGPRLGDHYLVREGLTEGERVVTRGNFKLDSALQIKAGPSMMNPPHELDEDDPARLTPEIISLASSGELLPATTEFHSSLETVYTAYFTLQYALSHDDHSGAVTAADVLQNSLEQESGDELTAESLRIWHLLSRSLMANTGVLAAAADLEGSRAAFEPVSRVMTAISRSFGRITGQPVYNYFCPMAFDYQGAFWLQEREGTENPYFGSGMFRCGTRQETIVADGADEHE